MFSGVISQHPIEGEGVGDTLLPLFQKIVRVLTRESWTHQPYIFCLFSFLCNTLIECVTCRQLGKPWCDVYNPLMSQCWVPEHQQAHMMKHDNSYTSHCYLELPAHIKMPPWSWQNSGFFLFTSWHFASLGKLNVKISAKLLTGFIKKNLGITENLDKRWRLSECKMEAAHHGRNLTLDNSDLSVQSHIPKHMYRLVSVCWIWKDYLKGCNFLELWQDYINQLWVFFPATLSYKFLWRGSMELMQMYKLILSLFNQILGV